MKDLNKVELIGRLVADPIAAKLASGQSLVRFRLATASGRKDKSGKFAETVEYHHLLAFAKVATVVESYLKKGDTVYVEGRLRTNAWQGKDGARHSRTETVVSNLIMLGGRKRKTEPEVTNDDVVVEEVDVDIKGEGA
jgi:single-strand DNA-binding protein